MSTEADRWFYQGRKDEAVVREYISGDFYAEYHPHGSFISGTYVKCRESTMKGWGRRITEQEAKRLIPDLDELRKQALAKLEQERAEESGRWRQMTTGLTEMFRRQVLSELVQIRELLDRLERGEEADLSRYPEEVIAWVRERMK